MTISHDTISYGQYLYNNIFCQIFKAGIVDEQLAVVSEEEAAICYCKHASKIRSLSEACHVFPGVKYIVLNCKGKLLIIIGIFILTSCLLRNNSLMLIYHKFENALNNIKNWLIYGIIKAFLYLKKY